MYYNIHKIKKGTARAVKYREEIRMNDIKQTTCKRCGRKLKNDEAIKRGMGIICWRKWQNENNHKKLWEAKDE